MNKWIGALIIICSLPGCATSPEATTGAEPKLTSQEALSPRVNKNTIIDEEVLYLLMAAELAGQRNQYDLALDAYLQAAKRVDDPRVAERAVKIGMFLKDENRTREALDIWLTKDPHNLSARKFAALLAIKANDKHSAIENLDVIYQEDPAGFEGGMLEIVRSLEKEGRTQFILDVFEELNQRNPDQAGLLFLQAVAASAMHENELAQQKISRVLELQPDWNKAIIFQAQLAGRSGDRVKAREYLEKAVKQAPDDKQLRKMLLELLVSDGSFDDAIKLCQSVLEAVPDDGETLFTMALIYMQQNQVGKAESTLEKLLNDPDWEGRASFYLGKIQIDQQRPDKALKWFERAEANGIGFEADMAMASLLLNQKQLDEAEALIKKMDVKYPEQHLRILMMKAELYNRWGKYAEAFDELTLALKDAPDNRDVLYARALVAERLDKLDVVESDLQKILAQHPDDVAALNALGYTLVDKTQRYDEAEQYLEKAMKLKPDEAVIIDSYGWLQFKKGRYELALEYLRKAYDNQQENEIAAHIAEVLWVMGRDKEAIEFFEPIFKKFPEDEYLLKFKQRFLPAEP